MAKTLVIVESPAKAKTINKYLPKGYKVIATMGHVRDLPKSNLGIDIENNFTPKYVTIRGKGDTIKKIKSESSSADTILLATDPDREGEAISWHIAHYLKINPLDSCRIEFHEITKNAITRAIENKRSINLELVDSQQARRILDRLVGYKLSPLLWQKIRKGLSAGRVQSVCTRIIVDREEEINSFIPKEYWLLSVMLKKEKKIFETKFYGQNNKKLEINSKNQVEEIIDSLKNNQFIVKNIKQSIKKRTAPLPFTTSTLQQEAYRKLSFSTKKTMMLAQQLYEGVAIEGQGQIGLITYLRTDSTRISQEAVDQCKNYVINNFGLEYYGNKKKEKKKKNVQDAHEAIRPTSVELAPLKIKDSLKRDQYRLYKLIWERFVASQMSPAEFDSLTVDISCGINNFKSQGSKLKFKGFMKLYSLEEDKNNNNNNIPNLDIGDILLKEEIKSEQKFTQPPARYTEASLVKALEEQGIGRPSTYAPTISTILNRGYVEVIEKKFHPTELGVTVTNLMKNYFKEIVDVDFTAELEDKLDLIAEGNANWKEIISDYYLNFAKKLENAEKEIEKIIIEDPVSDVICEKCGRNMVIKTGRYGKFLACPGFPECKNTKPLIDDTGVECPECGGKIIARKSKKGKVFYGCSNYPKCNFVTWDKPLEEKCSECGNILFEKGYGKSKKIYCSNEECKLNKNKKENKEKKDNKEKKENKKNKDKD